jgi:hypothetical protein
MVGEAAAIPKLNEIVQKVALFDTLLIPCNTDKRREADDYCFHFGLCHVRAVAEHSYEYVFDDVWCFPTSFSPLS